jgi:N-acylneuraminate cytidylyltransferase
LIVFLQLLKISDHFIWKKKGGKFLANYNFKKRPRRQIIEDKFLENGSFYIFNKKKFLKFKNRLFGKKGVYLMSKMNSFQIDDYEDIQLINKLVGAK